MSRSQWICNDRVGCWIRDGGRQVFKTAERSGSASNSRCGAGYNTMHWVCRWGCAGCWCVMTVCTRRVGWSNYRPSPCSRRGDICNAGIVQPRWGGGVLTLDCRGYGNPSLSGIPLASQYENASLSRGNLRIPVTATRDCGRVTAILYSRLATRLRSLVIILPIHLYLLSLESTFATVYHKYLTYAYMAECWRMCPYTIIAFQ